jgi:exosome complex RNA-binding protein Csl4
MYAILVASVLGLSMTFIPPALAEESGQVKAIAKSRDPSKYHTPEMSAQMIFGGAKYFVVGPIQKTEGNYYYIKDEESGEQVRVVMDEGTRVICSLQTASGPNGDCAFKPGDRVRAEVSDLGTVTTIRKLPSEEKLPYKTTMRQLGDIVNIASPTGDYVVLPAPMGSLREIDPKKPTPIKSPDGKPLGTLDKLIMDSGSGRIQYAVVRLADDNLLVPVPWGDLTISKQDGAYVLTNRGYQLEPPMSPKEAVDRSPKLQELYRIVKQLQDEIPPDIRGQAKEGEQKKGEERPQMAQAEKPKCPDPQAEKGDVFRGQVVDVQDNFLIVKDASGKLIHVHKDQCTRQASQRIRTGLFLPGDTVEAYITPKGHAITLSMLRAAPYGSFPDQ